MKTKSTNYSEKKYLKIEDSSSLVLIDVGTLVKSPYSLSPYIGKRLSVSEESFVDVWVDENSNALAFDLEGISGLFVTVLKDRNGNLLEIKLTPAKPTE